MQGFQRDGSPGTRAKRPRAAANRQELIAADGARERRDAARMFAESSTPWLADPATPPVKRFRICSGLTQRQVVERTGIPLRTYRELEHGRAPTMRQLIALCKLYGRHAEEFFPLTCSDAS